MRRLELEGRLEFPELTLERFHGGEGPRMCGIAMIRSLLHLQFGTERSENYVIAKVCEYHRQQQVLRAPPKRETYVMIEGVKVPHKELEEFLNDKKLEKIIQHFRDNPHPDSDRRKAARNRRLVIEARATPPTAYAYVLRAEVPEPLRIFCSRDGTVGRLDHLVRNGIIPITHQFIGYPKEKVKPYSHYMLFCGRDSTYVKFFDPSRGEGMKPSPEFPPMFINDYYKQWTTPKFGNERWYMAVVPERQAHLLKGLKGRYL